MQHGDIQIFRLIYAGGVYDYTEYVTITPPAGGGVLRFNPSTGYPEQMAVSADMMTLLSSADMTSMKSAAGLIDSAAFTWSNLPGKPSFFSGAYVDLTGKPTYATVATSGSYNDLSNKPTIPTIPGNATTSVSGLLSATDKGKLDGLSAPNSRSFNAPSFSNVTTANQLHAARDAEVFYDIDATVTISLLAGQSVTATLKYADNSGMSTNVVTVSSQVANNSGVLNLTQTNTLKLAGIIPAGKYRQVTFAVTGTGTATPTTLKAAQEIILP